MSELSKNGGHDTPRGKKRSFLLSILLIAGLCLYALGLGWADFLPTKYGFTILKEFSAAALTPALNYNPDLYIPETAPPYWVKILSSLWLTLQYATCAICIALTIGVTLGFFCTKSWWSSKNKHNTYHIPLIVIHRFARTIITFGRSIHELLWALLFITALGTSPFSAIMALAIPYGCTLAKVFSEIIDEQDLCNSEHLKSHGAPAISAWLFGIIPAAIPDMLSYALYRYECAIRSASILGFVGIATVGYHIETAFADGYYEGVWTLLYSLLVLLILIEKLSGFIRAKISSPVQMSPSLPISTDYPSSNREGKLAILRRQTTKPFALSIILISFSILALIAWNTGEPMFSKISAEQRTLNLERFLTKEITPYPVQQSGDWADAIPWAKNLLLDPGLGALLRTLYIATAAIIVAFILGLPSIPLAAKSFNAGHYSGITLRLSQLQIWTKKTIVLCAKATLMVTRSMPEFLLAFLLLQIFGSTAWPLILGLALHNYGILGRLGGEVVDNADPSSSKVAITHGANMKKVYLFTLFPSIFNRLLLYFFYRWETCIRDATVMGMLGISSLGFIINDASARDNRDEMFFFILLGACLVMVGDIISDIIRSRLRTT